MMSCSRAQMSMADTSPPSWPISQILGSAARARMMSLEMPETCSLARGRPKRWVSISGSQSRKRGQARVHDVQPRSPWPQSPGPPSSSRWKGL